MKVLVTGAAGFIGSALSLRLLARGDEVIGIDNLNDYYDVSLKQARLERTTRFDAFTDLRMDLEDRAAIAGMFEKYRPERVVNLAAQAGVRYSLINPQAYVDTNLTGFANILEGCRHHGIRHLVFASSSSVYGANTKMPLSIHDNVANELMAHTYSHLYRLPSTGLRFFTVYGPWGRPDMSYFLFAGNILRGKPIDVFNYGNHRRDFTYIDDVIEGVIRVLDRIPEPDPGWSSDTPDPASSSAPYRLYNIGNNQPVELRRYIEVLEDCLGKKAQMNLLPLQPGDVPDTYADVADLVRDVGYKPDTPIEVGLANFVAWYRSYFKV
jgi:UDP-glucuronate 4-epimerase